MKRALLILAGFLITLGFTMYILGVDPFSKNEAIGRQEDSLNGRIAAKAGEAGIDPAASGSNAEAMLADMPADAIKTAQTIVQSENVPPGWTLLWADEFDKPNVDIEHWTEVDRKESYNNEQQYYLPKNSYIKDGCLYLTAIHEDWGNKKYTSAMVETRDKLSFRYGRVEARIKLPKGQGVFPAFWILTSDGGYEIDIMEMIGSEPNTIYGTNHYETSRGSKKVSGYASGNTPDEFHVYAVEWEPDEIRWYLDGKLFHESTKGVPPDYMYMVLNLAVGGNWPGDPEETAFPCSMTVDYVRIYTREKMIG